MSTTYIRKKSQILTIKNFSETEYVVKVRHNPVNWVPANSSLTVRLDEWPDLSMRIFYHPDGVEFEQM